MKTGDASVVIDKFVSLVGARFGKGEMLNSGYVLELYEIDPDLKNDQRLKGIVSQIEILQLEIERGFD
ncbi:MAG: hypothetical protein EOP48_06040 [Sphingobacteriales bacterium]|nr:MAG: hypothetical protein EOP48_06040 [Sphingobacteriales bacterium]